MMEKSVEKRRIARSLVRRVTIRKKGIVCSIPTVKLGLIHPSRAHLIPSLLPLNHTLSPSPARPPWAAVMNERRRPPPLWTTHRQASRGRLQPPSTHPEASTVRACIWMLPSREHAAAEVSTAEQTSGACLREHAAAEGYPPSSTHQRRPPPPSTQRGAVADASARRR